nr:SDR family NAD(P)-dependent oxidoreductase [Propionibacterium sp.]
MARALVTGATAGLGAEFARQLARRGDDLVLVARDATRLDALASELRDRHGVEVEALPADLALPADVERVADRLGSDAAPVDVLVSNAGFGVAGGLLGADLAEHDRALDVMCRAVLHLGAAAGRAMRRRGNGRIVNVASLSAWTTQGHYSAIKAWVLVYSQALAGELHGTGVTVTALCPGWVKTEFHQRADLGTGGIPEPVWVDARRCVREALADADRGAVVSIPTKRWKAAALALDAAPRPVVRWISRRLARSRN